MLLVVHRWVGGGVAHLGSTSLRASYRLRAVYRRHADYLCSKIDPPVAGLARPLKNDPCKWRASLATGDPLLHESRVRHADGQIVGLGRGSTAAYALRHHDLRRALRSCRAGQKSEDVHLRISEDLCHMSQCAGSFCRRRPHRCAPFGLTPAKMLSYAFLWGRWYTRITVVQKRQGIPAIPAGCTSGK